MWTVGLALTYNAVGLSEEEWTALSHEEQRARSLSAYQQLGEAGAHYVIDSLADIEMVLVDISARIARGERP